MFKFLLHDLRKHLPKKDKEKKDTIMLPTFLCNPNMQHGPNVILLSHKDPKGSKKKD